MLGHLLLALAACLPVEGDRILIGDLVAAVPALASSDAAESIGLSPAPGVQRRFSAAELTRLAERKGISGPVEPVCFERKSEMLSIEPVLAALRSALPGGSELELLEFSRVQVPSGTLTLEFPRGGLTPAPAASPRDPSIWRGRAIYGTAQSVPIWARVRVWSSRPVWVAAEDLQVGKPIEEDQVRLEARETNPFAGAVATEKIAGMAARRPIRAGQLVPRNALEAPNEIARGEMVGIEARYGGALLKFEVRAEASGRIGDAIQVRNVESGKTFRAKVLRRGWVGVESTE